MDLATITIAAVLIWVVPVLLSVLYLRRRASLKHLNTFLRGILAPFRGIAWLWKYAFDENYRKRLELQEELRREYKSLELAGAKFAQSIGKEIELEKEYKSKLSAAREMLEIATRRLKHQKQTRNEIRKRRKQQQKQNKKRVAQHEEPLVVINLRDIEEISAEISIAEQKQSAARDEVQKLTEQLNEQRGKLENLRAEFAAVEVRATLAQNRAATKIAHHSLVSSDSAFGMLSCIERMEQKVRIREQQAMESYFGFPSPPSRPGFPIDVSAAALSHLSEEQKDKLQQLDKQVDAQAYEMHQRYKTLARLRAGLGIPLTSDQMALLKKLDNETIALLEDEYNSLLLEHERLELEQKKRQTREFERLKAELKERLEVNKLLKLERDVQRKAEMEHSVREYVAAESERRKLYKDTYEATSQKLQVFIDKTSAVTKKLRVVRDAPIVADPSLERAYERLVEQLAAARKLMDDSFEQEALLERQLKENGYSLETVDLQAALKNQRRKNLATEQQLFRVDGIVRRLYMVMILLKALPTSKIDSLTQYTNVVNDLCSFLSQSWDGTTEIKAPVEFSARIGDLENSALMTFIRIAKVDWKNMNAAAINQLKCNVDSVIEVIQSEKQNQTEELNKWSSLAAKAVSENKELIFFVTSQRRDQCREILKVTDQVLDVLKLSIAVTQKNLNGSAEAR